MKITYSILQYRPSPMAKPVAIIGTLYQVVDTGGYVLMPSTTGVEQYIDIIEMIVDELEEMNNQTIATALEDYISIFKNEYFFSPAIDFTIEDSIDIDWKRLLQTRTEFIWNYMIECIFSR